MLSAKTYALDVSDWSGMISEELCKFFYLHQTKPVIVVNAEGVLWPSNILLRFFKFIDSTPSIRKTLAKSHQLESSVSFSEEYKNRCRISREACYIWAATLFRDLGEPLVFQWARSFWDSLSHTVYLKPIGKLIHEFHKQHFPVWVLTPTPKWVAEVGALKYNIRPENVVSTKPVLHERTITQRLSYPPPYEIQKVFLVNSLIKTKPFIVIGHNYKDFEVLSISSSLSIVINPPKDQLDRNNLPFINVAKSMNWSIQDFAEPSY